MVKFVRSRIVMFVILTSLVIQMYWLFGVEQYRTPNLFGYLVLSLPLVLLIFLIWRRYRSE